MIGFAWARRLWLWLRPPQELHTVDFSFSSEELTLSVDEFSRRYIDPAIEILAAHIEAEMLADIKEQAKRLPWHKRVVGWLRLLWLPGLRRKAEPGRTLSSINDITAKSLAILHQKHNFVGALNHAYDEEKAKAGVEPGASLRIRLPVQYTIKTGN